MKLLQLPSAELRRQLAGGGVWLRTGPFSLKLQSRIPSVAEGLAKLYGQSSSKPPRSRRTGGQRSCSAHPVPAKAR